MLALIKNVKIPGRTGTHDLLIQNGRIERIGDLSDQKADQIVEGENLHVSSGWLDIGVQAWDPGHEHREDLDSMRASAATGGYTGVLVWPDSEPPADSKAGVRYVGEQADETVVRLYPMGAISKGCAGVDITEMIDMQAAGAVAFTDGLRSLRNNGLFLRALQYVTAFSGTIVHFPYDQSLSPHGQMHEGTVSTSLGLPGIPSISEDLMVARDLQLLAYSGSRLHLANISTAGSVHRIRLAKEAGLQVTASVPVWNLVFDDTILEGFDSLFKLMPPLRAASDREALIEGLKDGTIDLISSNHYPWEEEFKSLEFPYAAFGASGLETTYALLQDSLGDQFKPDELADLLGAKVRTAFGLDIPEIREGAIAELTVFDPTHSWTPQKAGWQSRSVNNPLFGKELKGKVKAVFRADKYKIFG